MPKLKMDFPHSLTREKVLEQIALLLPEVKEEFAGDIKDLHEIWTGNTNTFRFRVKRFWTVKGKLTVTSQRVELEADIPSAALLIMDMETIQSRINERATVLLRPKSP